MAQTINIVLNAAAAGTVDVITATYSPALTAYTDKRILAFRATGANTSTTPTFNANGLGAKTIVKKGNSALVAGDIPAASAVCLIQYDSTLDKFVLMNPASDNDAQTLAQVLNQGNAANQDINMTGNNLVNVNGVIDSSGNHFLALGIGGAYTVLTTDAEGYLTPFLYLEPGAEASLAYDTTKGFQATNTSSNVKHSSLVNIDAPNVNLPNETASRWMYLDASKNVDTKTDAQMSASVTANQTIGYQGMAVQVLGPTVATNPADATTYYFGMGLVNALVTTANRVRVYIPKAGTVKAAYCVFRQTAGSAETSTISFRLNNTTDTTISSSVKNDLAIEVFSNTGLNIAVVAGDYFEFKWVTPTWVTNPTNLIFSGIIYIE